MLVKTIGDEVVQKMIRELEIQKFLRKNPKNWKEILCAPPYSLLIKEGEASSAGAVLFKYDQKTSDFNIPLVKECRGIILDKDDNWNVIRYAYNKFFNYGEQFADDINWPTSQVQEKIDGSLMTATFWKRKGTILVSTNGTINAFETPVMAQGGSFLDKCPYDTFGALFGAVMNEKCPDWVDTIKRFPDLTFIFELVSPYNKIVVEYDKPDVYLTGIRNNKTFGEINPRELNYLFLEIERPKIYSLNGITECLNAVEALNKNTQGIIENEGYVVVDCNWKRVKIKSPLYAMKHYLLDKPITEKRVLEIIRAGEKDEFLTYCPNFKKEFDYVEEKLDGLYHEMEYLKDLTLEHLDMPQPEFVRIAKYYKKLADWMYKCRKENDLTPKEWLFGGRKYISKKGEEKITEGVFTDTIIELLGEDFDYEN